MELKKGDKIFFSKRDFGVEESCICEVVEKQKGIDGKEIEQSQLYIIEHENGWMPNTIRIKKFGLDKNKKYLFISESEIK